MECIAIGNTAQFDAFLGFVNSQQLEPKTTAYPDTVLLSLLRTCLVNNPGVSSVLEAEAANPLPADLTTETGFATKKGGLAFLDMVSSPRSDAASRLPPRVRRARCS